MAARENQGLQIALITFVMLTMALAVTTYLFYHNSQTQKAAADRAEANARTATNQANQAKKDLDDLKDMVGFDSAATSEDMHKAYDQDMASYAAGLDKKDQQKYRSVVKGLFAEMVKKAADASDAKLANTDLKQKLQAVEGIKQSQIDQYKELADKVAADNANERGKFNDARTAFISQTDEIKELKDKAEKELTDLADASKKQMDELQKNLSTTQVRLATAKDELNTLNKGEFSAPEGRITWVNQSTRRVWINLGRDDNLHKQITFSVYAYGENNVNKAAVKGKIEVMEILDRHMAEARIVQDSSGNPILPGDVIYTPIWHPGHSDHFALAGFMDLDKDGRSDRARVRDLIRFNGGIIDAEVDDKGQLSGEMNINTRYLILGSPPDEKLATPEMIAGFSNIQGQADKMGVEKKSLQEFLNQVGYVPERGAGQVNTAAAPTPGAKPAGTDAAPTGDTDQPKTDSTAPEAITPAAGADNGQFRPRTIRFP